jgi:RNA polymerase sigma-70 factor (ECF subfamily)
MNGRDDEPELIEACRRGDTSAFGILVRRYQDRLFPTMLRLSGRPEDAQDLLQDAFLKAFQKLKRFHGESSFYTWLYRIAVNLALSDRRRRRPIVGWEAPSSYRPGTDPPSSIELADPSEPLEKAELNQCVQAALNRLAKDHRAVVVLKDLDGLRYEEIAEILNIPVGTVRSRLHRARLELRERLRGLVEEQPIRGRFG